MRYLMIPVLLVASVFVAFRISSIRSEAIVRQLAHAAQADNADATEVPGVADGVDVKVDADPLPAVRFPEPPDDRPAAIHADARHSVVPQPTDVRGGLSAVDRIMRVTDPLTEVRRPEGIRSRLLSGMRQQGPQHPEMLTPANFEYLGGFRTPNTDSAGHSFGYGGWGVAFRPDPQAAADGQPSGSLFIVGHHAEQLVAEISIPDPVISQDHRMEDLPVAQVIQNLTDITGGLLTELTDDPSQPFEIGGMQVVGDRLHWTMFRFYNVDGNDFYSHGTSSLTLDVPEVEGPWHLGPQNSGRPEWHAHKHGGYVFDIPQQQADQWFGGRNLISGLQTSTGLATSSNGPAMIAYALPPRGTAPASIVDATPLMWYDVQHPAQNFHPADRWNGGAWLTLGNKQAVVVVGRKALGEVFYGDSRPGDCLEDRGFHGDAYEAQMLFYSPASLIQSAYGSMQAFEVTPWYTWSDSTAGGGFSQYFFPTCHQYLGGMAVDHANNLVYICQVQAGSTAENGSDQLPVIHVFRVTE